MDPPAPVQVIVKVYLPVFTGFSVRLPFTSLGPLQLPLAVQAEAPPDDHDSSVLEPFLITDLLKPIVSFIGVTSSVADLLVEMP